jgi:hypothetical protein
MSNTDYREGYRDGFKDGFDQRNAETRALAGPDMTAYYFVGGPKDGENIRTGGGSRFRVAVFPPYPMYASVDDPLLYEYTIKYGEYEKTRTSRGDWVYLYRGVTH